MAPIDLDVSDSKMADRWHMHTEFMLNRISASDLKRMVDDIDDGTNYRVNDEGNIVEADTGPIERNKEELNERVIEKVKHSEKPRKVIDQKIEDLQKSVNLPGMDAKEKSAKLSILRDVRKEAYPNE